MSLVFNDKTFQQADEGTLNVLKYTFGNGVNLVSVQQESLPDYYPESCVDPHLLNLINIFGKGVWENLGEGKIRIQIS